MTMAAAWPAGGGDAVHPRRRDGPRDPRRRSGPAARRGPVHGRPRPDRPSRHADGLRRLHLERRHADQLAGVRNAGVRSRAQIATGQLARRVFGLPHRTSNVTGSGRSSTRRRPTRSEMSIWGAVLGGASLLYQGAGWLEGGLTASFEKLILDAELLQQMADGPPAARRSMTTRSVSTRSPRSGRAATSLARRTRSPATRPRSTSRSSATGGTSRPGSRTARRPRPSAPTPIWKQLLAEYVPPPLDPGRAKRRWTSSSRGGSGGSRRGR